MRATPVLVLMAALFLGGCASRTPAATDAPAVAPAEASRVVVERARVAAVGWDGPIEGVALADLLNATPRHADLLVALATRPAREFVVANATLFLPTDDGPVRLAAEAAGAPGGLRLRVATPLAALREARPRVVADESHHLGVRVARLPVFNGGSLRLLLAGEARFEGVVDPIPFVAAFDVPIPPPRAPEAPANATDPPLPPNAVRSSVTPTSLYDEADPLRTAGWVAWVDEETGRTVGTRRDGPLGLDQGTHHLIAVAYNGFRATTEGYTFCVETCDED